MLIHYFKIAFRNIVKDKGYSLINILGLSVALACCFLLIFWIRYELSYERSYSNAKRIYQVYQIEEREDGPFAVGNIRPGISFELKQQFPQVEAATTWNVEMLPMTVTGEEGKDPILVRYISAEEDYLRMFELEYLEGTPEMVVDTRGLVISQETSRKFFGNESPIGKSLSFANRSMGTIRAVAKVPQNTQVGFDLLTVGGGLGIAYGIQYMMLSEQAKLTPEFEEQVAGYLRKIGVSENKLAVIPLLDKHLHSPDEFSSYADRPYGNLSQLYFFALAAGLILLMAVINYVNTSIARSLSRMKEVGVRKVNGAVRRRLVERFLFEALLISLISVALSLLFTRFFFRDFSEMMGNRLSLALDGGTVLIALVVCLVITLLSGGYAAFYLSSIRASTVLRGGSKTGSKEGLRKVLIGVQFFLSVTVLTCTTFIYKQIQAIFTADTGVDRENIWIMNTGLWYQSEDFFKVIKAENPNVLDATIAFGAPYHATWGYGGISWAGSSGEPIKADITQIFADHNYARVFGLELLEGEFLPPGMKWWQFADEDSHNIVINESMRDLLGLENPVGMTLHYGQNGGTAGRILGVVKDFNFKPLKEKISPLIISFNPEAANTIFVRTTGQDREKTWNYLVKKHDEMKTLGARPLEFITVEDDYRSMYGDELRTLKILSFFAVISLLLSLLGVVSMISFMIEKRTKEIAIRKINGAVTANIAALFSRDILRVALIASVAAIPLCYFLMHAWQADYVYRTPLSWWIFAGIPLLVMGLVVAVIFVQVYLTARKRPVESLRSE